MADDDYEILPRQELEYLRHEIERLKRNPLGDTQASVSLLDSINALNDNIERLVQIFESANQEMLEAFKEGSLQEQVNRMRQDNEKIAQGIVALSEQIEKLKSEPQPQSVPPQPSMQGPPGYAGNPFDDEPAPPSPPQDISDDEVPSPP